MDGIYQKIKNLRIESGLTLKDLSEKTELSVSFLSQIERGSSSLAITSLKKIADAFEVPVTFFFDSETNHNYMLQAGDRKPFQLEGASTTYSRLNGEFGGRRLEPLLVTLAPKQEQNQTSNHPGEEFYYVLKGAALFKVDGKEYFVREGDSIHYPSEVPHSWENPLNEETIILCVLTPVIF
ncbi:MULTISPECIES: XRE family transcriptional regulator [Planococcaceae]|uniref:DNA-binding protein n=1 Tax=Planococcus halotolerans TaxID=2233542 RepID=A0A365KWX6_9BACL|nr:MULTISPECIES: XRE family transcriptional regulator [Planococcaceae]QHJ69120.1 cupin domain-containing protein [Planococcus halotolerans]RAZ77681.1 DNA-binding protein [Planococcus halotolerans]RLQ91304.1 XRE family transcriptional regulator [Planomicrobium sp. Y74]